MKKVNNKIMIGLALLQAAVMGGYGCRDVSPTHIGPVQQHQQFQQPAASGYAGGYTRAYSPARIQSSGYSAVQMPPRSATPAGQRAGTPAGRPQPAPYAFARQSRGVKAPVEVPVEVVSKKVSGMQRSASAPGLQAEASRVETESIKRRDSRTSGLSYLSSRQQGTESREYLSSGTPLGRPGSAVSERYGPTPRHLPEESVPDINRRASIHCNEGSLEMDTEMSRELDITMLCSPEDSLEMDIVKMSAKFHNIIKTMPQKQLNILERAFQFMDEYKLQNNDIYSLFTWGNKQFVNLNNLTKEQKFNIVKCFLGIFNYINSLTPNSHDEHSTTAGASLSSETSPTTPGKSSNSDF